MMERERQQNDSLVNGYLAVVFYLERLEVLQSLPCPDLRFPCTLLHPYAMRIPMRRPPSVRYKDSYAAPSIGEHPPGLAVELSARVLADVEHADGHHQDREERHCDRDRIFTRHWLGHR